MLLTSHPYAQQDTATNEQHRGEYLPDDPTPQCRHTLTLFRSATDTSDLAGAP